MSSNPLVGTWRLLSFESRDSNGNVSYPLGKEAVGYLMYTEDGYMSVSIMKADRAKTGVEAPLLAKPEDKIAAADSYLSYSGRYEIRPDGLVHHVEFSLFPDYVGTVQERTYRLSGDRLVIDAPPISILRATFSLHLTWEKAVHKG